MYKVNPIRHGYFLAQELCATGAEVLWRKFGNEQWVYSCAKDARPYFEHFKDKLNGVDFVPMVYQDQDIAGVVEVAKLAQDYAIDLWLGPRIYKQIDNLPVPPARFTSWMMDEKGLIHPAVRDVKRRPDIDRFNPDAVKWFREVYYDTFLKHFEPNLLHGLFWPEEHLGANLAVVSSFSAGQDYWHSPVYSDSSLEQWREYCRQHDVTHNNRTVDAFPVHAEEMEAQGKGKTKCYPGFTIGAPDGTRSYAELPRCTGVWRHWYNYLCHTFFKHWILPLSEQMHALNRNNPRWRGVVYFGLSQWLIPYERCAVAGRPAKIPLNGYQYGMNVELLAKHPAITYVIHEFGTDSYPRDMHEIHEVFLSLLGTHREKHGLMVHRLDDMSRAILPSEERERWGFIKRYAPEILSFYCLRRFFPHSGSFDSDGTRLFFEELTKYQSGI
ncbi:MAG: hypothetical protein V2A65_08900 [Candidatus Omnitrophota bacterium]